MISKYFLFGILLMGIVSAAEKLDVSFDNQNLGTYTRSKMRVEWAGENWDNGLGEGRGRIVDGANAYAGKALEVRYLGGKFGPEAGVQFQGNFTATDAATLEYRVKFPAGFKWTKGGKLPGLCGGTCSTGDENPTGANGWSARYMWRENGQAILYLYHMNWTNHGDQLDLKLSGANVRFETGRWHHLKQSIKMNTPDKRDGQIIVWLDGKEVLRTAFVKFRSVPTLKINKVYFSTFFGGSDNSWSPSSEQIAYFDDFHIYPDKPSSGLAFQATQNGLIRSATPGWTRLTAPSPVGTWILSDSRGKTFGRYDGEVLSQGKWISMTPGNYYWLWHENNATNPVRTVPHR